MSTLIKLTRIECGSDKEVENLIAASSGGPNEQQTECIGIVVQPYISKRLLRKSVEHHYPAVFIIRGLIGRPRINSKPERILNTRAEKIAVERYGDKSRSPHPAYMMVRWVPEGLIPAKTTKTRPRR